MKWRKRASAGIDKVVAGMESDPRIVLDWKVYSIAGNGYLKDGQLDKTLAMTKKLEEHINTPVGSSLAFNDLLRLYAEARQRDEVDRVLMLCKRKEKTTRTI